MFLLVAFALVFLSSILGSSLALLIASVIKLGASILSDNFLSSLTIVFSLRARSMEHS